MSIFQALKNTADRLSDSLNGRTDDLYSIYRAIINDARKPVQHFVDSQGSFVSNNIEELDLFLVKQVVAFAEARLLLNSRSPFREYDYMNTNTRLDIIISAMRKEMNIAGDSAAFYAMLQDMLFGAVEFRRRDNDETPYLGYNIFQERENMWKKIEGLQPDPFLEFFRNYTPTLFERAFAALNIRFGRNEKKVIGNTYSSWKRLCDEVYDLFCSQIANARTTDISKRFVTYDIEYAFK